MPHLNFKYGLFPTEPQRRHLSRIMQECRYQWNHAVYIRKQLLKALQCGHVAFILETLLSANKQDTQSQRRAAILKMASAKGWTDENRFPYLYDMQNILGDLIDVTNTTDIYAIEGDLRTALMTERQGYKTWKQATAEANREYERQIHKGIEAKKPTVTEKPKTPVFYAFLRAINQYAGFKSKDDVSGRYTMPKSRQCSTIRFDVSGNAKSKWTRACNPSREQRLLGNKGVPQRKKHADSFGYAETSNDVVRYAKKTAQVKIKGMPPGMEWVSFNMHRAFPPSGQIKHVTVVDDKIQWTVVFSLQVSERDYALPIPDLRKAVGIDPGIITALTMAILNRDTGAIEFAKHHHAPLQENLEKLHRIEEEMEHYRKPDRKKKQKPSHRWVEASFRRTKLHKHIANQRKDILHKISRELAQYGHVAIGQWEQVRTVKDRKKFKWGEKDKVEPGHKGIVKKRRDAADRSMATLRRMTEEKVERAGGFIDKYADEYNTTKVCSSCGNKTGPESLSERQWTCSECGTTHDRDENSAVNILMKSLEIIGGIDKPEAAL